MRLKLVFVTSLLGALLGAGASIIIVVTTFDRRDFAMDSPRYGSDDIMGLVAYAPPLLLALLAAIFVYRHTARRRKLQAVLTGVLVLVLSIVLLLGALFVVR